MIARRRSCNSRPRALLDARMVRLEGTVASAACLTARASSVRVCGCQPE